MTDISKAAVDALLQGVTDGPKWEYVESASHDGQEWFGCGVAPTGGTEFIWLERNAERDIPIARFIAAARELVPALRAALDEADAERDAANALLREIYEVTVSTCTDKEARGWIEVAARAHLGAKP